VTYAFTALMAVVALVLTYVRRRHWAEAATILIVALPITFWVPPHAERWYRSLREDQRLSTSAVLVLAPPVIRAKRNLPLAQRALSAIAADETYAVVSHLATPKTSGERRRALASRKYLESWLQYWLAPRIQTDPAEARWLIVLDGAGRPVPPGARTVYRAGDDLLVRR